MRCLFFLSFLLLQTAAGQPSDDTEKKLGSIEGKVVNSATGGPVRKANLRMFVMPSNHSMTTASDADGKFVFDRLEPGSYNLVFEKSGFVQTNQRSPTTFTLGPGQKVSNVELKLAPQAVVSGRVVDEEGEPVANAMIYVMRQTAYTRQPMGVSGSNSNDVGEFRIPQLTPGKYVVRAQVQGSFGASRRAGAPEGEGKKDYVPTYYPSSPDVAAASPIVVASGQEIRDIEIRLRKSRVFQISGKVRFLPGSPKSAHVMLRSQTASQIAYMIDVGEGNVEDDGQFVLSSVQPGAYYAIALTQQGGVPHSVGKAAVHVTNRDVDNVVIEPVPPVVVTGRVIAEGDKPTKLRGQVMLRPVEGLSFSSGPGQIGEDGTFKQENVTRDKHSVMVFGLNDDFYVSSVRLGSVDVLEDGLDLSGAASTVAVEIRVSAKGGTVEGIVRKDDKPARGVMVTLFPQTSRREAIERLTKSGNTDENGRFTIKGIMPGEYRVIAFQEYLPVGSMEPEEIKALEPFAATVTVKELSREQVELKLATPPGQ